MFGKKQQKPEAPKEFKEEDYENEDMEEELSEEVESQPNLPTEKALEAKVIKKAKVETDKPIEDNPGEEKQTPVNLTEQDILALSKWHIARSFELLKLLN